jgi:hypothetical protein
MYDRATAGAAAAAVDDEEELVGSGLQLQLLERERLDAMAARDEADLARLQALAEQGEGDFDGEDTLMDPAHLPPWLVRLEEAMLGLNKEEQAWGALAPDAKRRRVARFDSLSDAAIFQQRVEESQQSGQNDARRGAGTAAAGRRGCRAMGSGGSSKVQAQQQQKQQPRRAGTLLVPAPSGAVCVKCVVEDRVDEKPRGDEEECLLCPGCDNPFHSACLLGEGGERCMFCEAEE